MHKYKVRCNEGYIREPMEHAEALRYAALLRCTGNVRVRVFRVWRRREKKTV